jgi:hypothetical protein
VSLESPAGAIGTELAADELFVSEVPLAAPGRSCVEDDDGVEPGSACARQVQATATPRRALRAP